MIEVCFIDFFSSGRKPTDILKRKMAPVVRISSTRNNSVLKVKVVYAVSSTNNDYDQVLCSETVEGIPAGVVEFELETEIPDMGKIPREHLIGLTSILFIFYTESGREFSRVGYFVKVDYPGIQVIDPPAPQEEALFEIDDIDIEYSGSEEADQDEQDKNEEEGNREGAPEEDLNEEEDSKEIEIEILEEAEEAEEAVEEINTEGMHDGILFVTEENFKKMELDLSKLEGEVLDPPLVTVFSEACDEIDPLHQPGEQELSAEE